MLDKAQPPHYFKLDINAYKPYLENTDIPDTEKHALIETLWSVVTSFVQLGYGLTPTQQALNTHLSSCGQNAQSQDNGAISDVVLLKYSPAHTQDGGA